MALAAVMEEKQLGVCVGSRSCGAVCPLGSKGRLCGTIRLGIVKKETNWYLKGQDALMNHCGTQRLETDRLILRRYRNEDAAAMYQNWASDEEVTKYLTWPAHSSQEVSQKVIEDWVNQYSSKNQYHWAVVLKDNGDEPVGDINVVNMREDISMAHIGYCIGRAWWHQGIMSEALKAVMDFLFDVVDVNRIEARHDPRNPNSGKVMKKCGMGYEGTLRSAGWNNQGICDDCCYALLKAKR